MCIALMERKILFSFLSLLHLLHCLVEYCNNTDHDIFKFMYDKVQYFCYRFHIFGKKFWRPFIVYWNWCPSAMYAQDLTKVYFNTYSTRFNKKLFLHLSYKIWPRFIFILALQDLTNISFHTYPWQKIISTLTLLDLSFFLFLPNKTWQKYIASLTVQDMIKIYFHTNPTRFDKGLFEGLDGAECGTLAFWTTCFGFALVVAYKKIKHKLYSKYSHHTYSIHGKMSTISFISLTSRLTTTGVCHLTDKSQGNAGSYIWLFYN